jgi:signal-transduction protein with cAMP-binding, CBS, and nucleotidyltransferase domain
MSPLEKISEKTSFVPEDTPLSEVAFLVGTSDAGVVGIMREGTPVGTVSDHEIVTRAVALGRDLSRFRAKHVMEPKPVTLEWLADDSDLVDAAILMRRTKARHAIVTQNGKPIGIVSFNALTRCELGA